MTGKDQETEMISWVHTERSSGHYGPLEIVDVSSQVAMPLPPRYLWGEKRFFEEGNVTIAKPQFYAS